MTGIAVVVAVAGVLAATGVGELIAASASRRARATRRDAGRPAGRDGARAAASDRRLRSASFGARSGVRLLAGIGSRLPARPPSSLRRRIDAAGVCATPADLMALKVGSAVAGLALALLIGAGIPGSFSGLVLLGGPLLGFLAPDEWLRRRTRQRRRAMDQELGDVLELLRVGIEAGLTVARALGEVGRRHPGVLAAEIRRAARLLELGVGQRIALDTLVSRCPTPGVATLVAALGRAERHGAPLGDALAAQAEEARARRARAAIEVAARAAPKIQLIVALLLVPSAMLLMAAAMLPALAWR